MAEPQVPPPNLRMLEGKIGANTATGQVLRQLRDVTHEEPHSRAHTDHDDDDGGHGDEVEHVDERWLVSYADMMTLLFGLFVMLYSMANKFEKVQQTVSKTFEGDPKTAQVAPPPPPPPAEEKLKALEQDLEARKLLNAQLQVKFEQLTKDNEALKTQPKIDPNQEIQRKLEQVVKENQLLKAKPKADLTQEIRRKLEVKEQELKALQESQKQLPSPTKLAAITHENDTLKEKIRELTTQATESSELKRQLEKVTHEVEILKKAQADRQGFMAYVINWNTKDHDIDLVIEDPAGKRFDFKNRKYPDHPGNLALDTRRGPGTEVWQSEKILPGTYTATYIFYNQYGNPEPAPVQASIFTPAGQMALPSVQLNFATKKTATLKFQVSVEGKVTILKEQ